ncbi:hypothetical protein GCM10010136_15360 [Limoniibacter endophyticus]|uniref:Uncharacterized protein n=1 Tax=Limoniibacter endophyticus TaxID=1565040 RepID=A0A8J3DI87_9HYPH|nr:hypothetical protein GCM10010136_15360 [Limoniibacter endophyticus]
MHPANERELRPSARVARAAKAGAGAGAFRTGIEALNELSVKVGTRKWLEAHETRILCEMDGATTAFHRQGELRTFIAVSIRGPL